MAKAKVKYRTKLVTRYRSVKSKVKARARKGGAFLGGMGLSPKSIAAGVGVLTLVKRLIGPNSMFGVSLGEYDPPLQKIATGVVCSALKADNKDMISVGIKEGVSVVLDRFIAGQNLLGLGAGGLGGNGGQTL